MATQDDRPELLIKLQERKALHKQRNILHRIAIVIIGVLIVLAGIVMSGPGVPGPGIVTIILGLGFLALEFDWAERWLERVIIWATAPLSGPSAPRRGSGSPRAWPRQRPRRPSPSGRFARTSRSCPSCKGVSPL